MSTPIEMLFYGQGQDGQSTIRMLEKPVTSLSRLIGQEWFLPLERLAEQSGVSLFMILKAVNGKKIPPKYEEKLRAFLRGQKDDGKGLGKH